MTKHTNTAGFFVLLLTAVLPYETVVAGVIKGKVQCKGARDNRDAVVYLENVPGTFPAPTQQPEIDQMKMTFIPHVLAVLVGTTVKFLNSDPVLHNVFTPSKPGNRFNLGSWPKGQTKPYTFDKPGEVRLLCNVHPEMEAWVIVLANPYFAKTSSDGSFSIANVPAGKYTLKVWHEKSKFPPREIEVPATGDATANLAAQ
jgi:plastocyanin